MLVIARRRSGDGSAEARVYACYLADKQVIG